MSATLETSAQNQGQQGGVSAETQAAVAAPQVVVVQVSGSGGGAWCWPAQVVVAVLQPGTKYRARNAKNVIAYRVAGSYNARNNSGLAAAKVRAEAIRAELAAKYAA